MARESEHSANQLLAATIRVNTFSALPHSDFKRLRISRKAKPSKAWVVLAGLFACAMFLLGRTF